jgi:hypothetical protein
MINPAARCARHPAEHRNGKTDMDFELPEELKLLKNTVRTF